MATVSVQFRPVKENSEGLIAHVTLLDDEGMIKRGKFVRLPNGELNVIPPVQRKIDNKISNPWYVNSAENQKKLVERVLREYQTQVGTLTA